MAELSAVLDPQQTAADAERAAIAAVALAAARAAAELLLSRFGQVQEIGFKKGDKDLVTALDKESEALIARHIAAAFPTHALLAEEGTKLTGGDGVTDGAPPPYTWIVDPLDGTTNYAHGFPVFAVSIAVEIAGEIVVGVVSAPALGEVFTAQKGHGAQLNGQPIHVSTTDALKRALVGSSAMYSERHHPQAQRAHRLLRVTQAVRNLGASAVELCYVADGRLDAYLQPGLQAWDMAAASLIIREAGGTLSTMQGTAYHVHRHQIVASNGHLHAELIGLLNPSLAQRVRWLYGGQWPQG